MESQVRIGGEEGNEEEVEIERRLINLRLYKAALRGDWAIAKEIFDNNNDAVTAKISGLEETALHVAIAKGRLSLKFIQQLLDLMPANSLVEAKNIYGQTAVHYASVVGNTEVLRMLLRKNPRLINIPDNFNNTALHIAAENCHREVVSCLLAGAAANDDPSAFTGNLGVRLVNLLIIAGFYDIAIHVLEKNPKVATEKDKDGLTALETLAEKPSAFPSGSLLGFWERLLYQYFVRVSEPKPRGGDVESPAKSSEDNYQHTKSTFKFLQRIQNTRLMHNQVLELLKLLIGEAVKMRPSKTKELLECPLQKSVQYGIVEIAVEIIKAYPESVWFMDKDGRNIFHLAVLYHQKSIFNLLYQLSSHDKQFVTASTDKDGNSMLHLAAKLSSRPELDKNTPSDALQMHSDFKWFKDVEKVVQPIYSKTNLNNPKRIFREEHQRLIEQGEKWMKGIAKSCTVVAALVVTVVFAAAFTSPGGNNQDNGIPIYLKKKSFMIFAVSDAVAFFSSSTSLLMFLCLLNSSYSEGEDFARSFKMLTIGFITMFLSIVAMVAAFGASLYLVLFHHVDWVAAPIITAACLPVGLFAYFQFPLWAKILHSAFEPSIVDKNTEGLIF